MPIEIHVGTRNVTLLGFDLLNSDSGGSGDELHVQHAVSNIYEGLDALDDEERGEWDGFVFCVPRVARPSSPCTHISKKDGLVTRDQAGVFVVNLESWASSQSFVLLVGVSLFKLRHLTHQPVSLVIKLHIYSFI